MSNTINASTYDPKLYKQLGKVVRRKSDGITGRLWWDGKMYNEGFAIYPDNGNLIHRIHNEIESVIYMRVNDEH